MSCPSLWSTKNRRLLRSILGAWKADDWNEDIPTLYFARPLASKFSKSHKLFPYVLLSFCVDKAADHKNHGMCGPHDASVQTHPKMSCPSPWVPKSPRQTSGAKYTGIWGDSRLLGTQNLLSNMSMSCSLCRDLSKVLEVMECSVCGGAEMALQAHYGSSVGREENFACGRRM
jgi:hypothetical protein